MAIITRSIHNATLVNIDLFVPGYDTIKPQVVIPASTTVDLFTVLTGDELEAIQNQLANLVAAGDITVTATVDTATFNPVGGGGGGGGSPTGPTDSIQVNDGSGGFLGSGNFTYDDTVQIMTLPAAFIDGANGILNLGASGQVILDSSALSLTGITSITGGNDDFAIQPHGGHSLELEAADDGSMGMTMFSDGSFQFTAPGGGDFAITVGSGVSIDLDGLSIGLGKPLALDTLTTTNRDALTPAAGWVIWNSSTNQMNVYDGTGWKIVTVS